MTTYRLHPTDALVADTHSGHTPPSGDVIVGSGAVLGDDDDATYVHLQASSDGTGWGVSGVFEALDPAATAGNITAITWHVRMSVPDTESSASLDVAVDGGFDGSNDFGPGSFAIPIVADGVPHDYDAGLDPSDPSYVDLRPDWLAALYAGAPFYASASVSLGGAGVEVQEVWIDVVTGVETPCDTWVDLDLSTAVFTGLGAGGPFGQYGDGVIYSANFPGFPDFYVPGIDLDATKRYLVEVTYDPSSAHDSGGRGFSLTGVIPGQEDDPNTVSGFPIGDLFDGSGNTLDTVTVTIGPGINGWDDATYGVAAGYSGLWFETDRDGAVSGIRIRKVCDPSLDPIPPTPGGSSGSPGGAPNPDGDGPTAPLGDSAAPAGATLGGFLNPGNRRGAPTEVDVVVNGHWLSLECQWGDLRYSTTWPGGSGNASWSATSIPARLTRPDLSVTLMFAGQPVWAGVLSEPGDGEMDAVGLFTLGDNFTALDSDGDATTVIDDAIDAAITRGLRWKRRDSISDDALDLDVSTGPATLRGLLDAYCDAEAKRWGVDPYGYVYVAADPTTPDYYVQDFGPLAPSTDDLATALVGRYYDGSDYLTTIVTSPSVAWLGYHEQTIDLTGRGTITEARAKHILGNLLARGLSLPTWATPLAATYGELLTSGQVPAALETVRAGEMVRSMGQLDDTQSAGGQTWVDVVIGSGELYEGALSLTPISAPARTFADVLARAARAS